MTPDKIKREDIESLLLLCKMDGSIALDQIEWTDTLIQLGIKHGVGAWCYYQIKNSQYASWVSEEVLKPWKQLYLQTSLVNQQKINVYFQIQQLLNEAGILVIALKGIALTSIIYPDEGLRPMGDIDLLVPEGEAMRALDILLKAGAKQNYVPRSALHEQVHSHVRAVTFKGVLIEIHQRLFSLGNPYQTDIDLFEYAVEKTVGEKKMLVLNEVWFGYHQIAHAATNLYKGGLRVGWLVDLLLLFNRQNELGRFVDNLLEINPKMKKEIEKLCKIVLYLKNRCNVGEKWYNLEEDLIKDVIKPYNNQKHKIIDISEIAYVPGVVNKFLLVWREFFPVREYMVYRYGKGKLMRLYIKRVLRF